MAFPFGGHPEFCSYLTWAAQTEGCRVQTTYGFDAQGRPQLLTRITAPNGKHVIVAGVDQHERLVPTMIAYLDRRLGLKSPYFSLPDDFSTKAPKAPPKAAEDTDT